MFIFATKYSLLIKNIYLSKPKPMKPILSIIFTILLFNVSYAQHDTLSGIETNEYRTIFNSSGNEVKVSGFAALNLDFLSLDNNFGITGGLDMGALFNRSFFFGIYGRINPASNTYTYSFEIDEPLSKVSTTQNALFGHGGLLVGAVFFPGKPFHLGISGRFGGGGISMVDHFVVRPPFVHNYDDYYNPSSGFIWVFSPQIDFEMNITNWLKFRISAGYQLVQGSSVFYYDYDSSSKEFVEKELLNTSSYSSPTLSLGFVFGMFK